MIEDSLALTIGSRQGPVIQDLHLRTHQEAEADVPGNPAGDGLVLIGFDTWPSFHFEGHIIATILSPFKVYLELAAYLGNG